MNTKNVGDPNQLSKGARFHFTHDVQSVDLYRDFADAQISGNALIPKTRTHQCDDLPLARSKRLVQEPQLRNGVVIGSSLAVRRNRPTHRIEHFLRAEG